MAFEFPCELYDEDMCVYPNCWAGVLGRSKCRLSKKELVIRYFRRRFNLKKKHEAAWLLRRNYDGRPGWRLWSTVFSERKERR